MSFNVYECLEALGLQLKVPQFRDHTTAAASCIENTRLTAVQLSPGVKQHAQSTQFANTINPPLSRYQLPSHRQISPKWGPTGPI
jgi:hypothetical protein